MRFKNFSIVLITIFIVTLLGCSNSNSVSTTEQSSGSDSTSTVKNKSATEVKGIERLKTKIVQAEEIYDEAVHTLNQLYTEYPRWEIRGEITHRGDNEISVWGEAESEDALSNHPGWLKDVGNIHIIHPNQDKISYNDYQGGVHWYIKQAYGTNAFGQQVPINIYGEKPKVIAKAERERDEENDQVYNAVGELVNFVNNDYNSKRKSDPNNPKLYVEYGDIYYDLNDFLVNTVGNRIIKDYDMLVEAVANYKKAFELNPKDTSVALLLADIYFNYYNDGRKIAKKYYQKVIDIDPETLVKADSLDTLEENYDAGLVLMENNLFDKAIQSLRKAKKCGTSPWINYNLSISLTKEAQNSVSNGNLEEGIKLYEDALQEISEINNLSSEWKIGHSLHTMEHLTEKDGVITLLQISTYQSLARLYEKTGNADKSIEYFNHIIKVWDKVIDPNSIVRFNSQKDSKVLNKLISKSAEDSLKLALLYSKQGKWEDSYYQFYRAIDKYLFINMDKIETNSEDDFTHYLLGLAYFEYCKDNLRKSSEATATLQKYAMEEIEKAIALNETNPLYQNTLGHFYSGHWTVYKNRDKKKAKVHLKRAIELDPKYKRAYGNLAMLTENNEKREKYTELSHHKVGVGSLEENISKYAPQFNK
ncbi:hypothetical protein U472_07410 [Orenia metallireducens]|uniref:Tetratricopeptide repeat-containing protein n=1 Tax=Orenia metallireducens TaxID=1413210 RepID=A0A1C0AAG8_9FIRM|nr:hypothetical protein [Orenia metallireducens]OCL27284.1 hypothetical protein U472_07410 [Orenia metallireducens]